MPQKKPVNLLELKPLRKIEWEENNDSIILLVPKFKNKILVKFLLPHLKSKHFRVKLDSYGSSVWKMCDGNNDVHQIGESLKQKFGDSVEPLYDRIGIFLQKLESYKFISFDNTN